MAGGIQRGESRSGIGGIVRLSNDVTGALISAPFHGDCFFYSTTTHNRLRERRGRGDTTLYSGFRALAIDSELIIRYKFQGGTPAPVEAVGTTGNITFQIDTGKIITVPVLVSGFGPNFNVDKDDKPYASLSARITGPIVYTGWPADEPTPSAPTKADKEVWEGTTKHVDPQGLLTGATRVTDVWGSFANTDAGEQAVIAAYIVAALPPILALPHDLKLRDVAMQRDAFDGGQVVEQWGLTNTKEDVEKPGTTYSKDTGANEIWGQVDIRKVQTTDTISWPSTPSDPADLKHGTVDKVQLNDSRWALTYHFVRNDSTDSITLPRTKTTSDPNDIGESATIALVTNSETPPSTPAAPIGQLIETSTEPVTKANGSYTGFWVHTFFYGPTTKLQEIQFSGNLIVDPSQINDADVIPVVSDTSTAPATPTPTNTDLKLVRRTSSRFQGTPEKWKHVFEFARNTAEDEREHTQRHADPDAFEESERIPVLHTSGSSAPSTPSPVNTTQLVGTDVERVCVPSGSFTGLWVWAFLFGPTTKKQEIEQDGELLNDIDDLDEVDTQTLTSTSSGSPAAPGARIVGMVLVSIRSRKVQNTPEKWRHTYLYGWRTSGGKLIAAQTFTDVDPAGLESKAGTAEIWSTGGAAPATPTLAGFVLNSVRDVETNNALYRLRIYSWSLSTTAQKRTLPKNTDHNDANNIADESVRAQLWDTSGSAPATPTDAPTLNVKLIGIDDVGIPETPGFKLRVWVYGPKDSADEQILPNYETVTDASALDSTAVRAYLDGDSVPSTPSGTVLRDTKVRPVTLALGVNRTLTVLIFGTRTHEQDRTFTKSRAIVEAGNIDREPEVCVVTSSSTPDFSAINPDSTNLSLYWTVSQQETNSGKWVHVGKFAPLTATERMTAQFERDDIDPASLEDEHTRVLYGSTTTPSAAPSVSGQVLSRTEVQRVGKVKYRFIYRYKFRTSADQLAAEKFSESVDASGIESEAVTAAVWLVSGGAPADPVTTDYTPDLNAALKLRGHDDHETLNPLYRFRIYRWSLTTVAEKIQRDATSTDTDPNGLQSKAQQAFVQAVGDVAKTFADATISLPADVEADDTVLEQLNDGFVKRTLRWATNSSKNLWERLKKKVTTDVGHVGQEAIIVKVLTTATPAADDTYNPDTTNLEFSTVEVIPISSTQFAHIYTFSPLSPKDRAVESFGQVVDDPVTLLVGDDQRRIIDANATTSAPAVSGRVCVRRLTHKIGRTLYQHDYWYDFRSVGDSLEAKQTRTRVDLSALGSEAVTADVWTVASGAPVAPTLSGFQLIDYEDREIENPLYRLRVYSWSLVTNSQKLTFAETKAIGDPLEVYQYEVTTIVSDTGSTVKALATAARDANKANAEFVKALVWRLTPDLVAQTLTFTGEDQKRHSYSGHTILDDFQGKPAAGFDVAAAFGVATSFVKVILPVPVSGGPGGATHGIIEPTYWRRKITYFKVRRRFITTTARQPEDFEFRAQAGTVNSGTFLGYPAHWVMFEVAEVLYNGTVNDNHLIVVDLCFKVDSLMHMIDKNLPSYGDHTVYNAGALLALSGYTNPDTTFSNNTGVYYMDWPAASSFASFSIL